MAGEFEHLLKETQVLETEQQPTHITSANRRDNDHSKIKNEMKAKNLRLFRI